MRQPNILWICTDQQRWDTLSFLGHAGARTPQIDRLAAQGTAFDRAYCQSPICTPSRASFLSGKYPIATGVQRNGNVGFPDHIVLLPRLFRDAGYRTGLIGKLHLSRAQGVVETRPADDGYDEFYWSHHPDPDWAEGHDYQDWLASAGSTRRRSTTRADDRRRGRRRGAPDHLGRRAGEAVHAGPCRAAVASLDQPLRPASAIRPAGAGRQRAVRYPGLWAAGGRGGGGLRANGSAHGTLDEATIQAEAADSLAPFASAGTENPYLLTQALQEEMQADAMIARTEEGLQRCLQGYPGLAGARPQHPCGRDTAV